MQSLKQAKFNYNSMVQFPKNIKEFDVFSSSKLRSS